jgi:hypothetical protein
MRLTLRTLLSYLDDTLEPAQASQMGEKAAHSEVAADLIDRIAKVTRRRGLSAPTVAGDEDDASAEPNTVAEYLDNALPAEQVAEVEKAALDSDARLAEVAACHQILTLVLGEPAKVPPTARQRMYRVVKGKESIPYRKPLSTTSVAGIEGPDKSEDEKAEADENPLLGITGSRLVVPIAASLALAALLAVVVYLAVPAPKPAPTQGYVSLAMTGGGLPDAIVKQPEVIGKAPSEAGKSGKELVKKGPEPSPEKKNDVDVKKDPPLVKKGPEPEKKNDVEVKKDVPIVKKDLRPIVTPPNKPDPDRRVVGRLETRDALLLQRRPDGLDWERAVPAKDLYSADTLLSLPGNQNEIRLDSGVRLVLWGSMPEFHSIGAIDLMETRIKLHSAPIGIDADFTLESGRVFITRPVPKGEKADPARVRIRFKDELWEVALIDPETEVSVDLIGYYGEGVPFSKQPGGPSPTTEVNLGILSGRAGLKLKFKEYAMLEAPTRVDWDSASQDRVEPKKIEPKHLAYWDRKIKDDFYSRELQAAVTYYAKRFSKPDEAKIDVALYSAMQDPGEQPGRRLFALRSLQALDAYEFLPTALADEVFLMRRAAIRAIQHWTGLANDRDLLIFKTLINKKGYTEAQAQYVMQLLHPFGETDYSRPEIVAALFEAMNHEKLAVRELAYKHLEFCDPNGAREVGFFNAAAEEKSRDAVLQKWKASWKRRFIDKLEKQ